MNLDSYSGKKIVARNNGRVTEERRKIVATYMNTGYGPSDILNILIQANEQKEKTDVRPYINPQTNEPWGLETIRRDYNAILENIENEETRSQRLLRARLFSQRQEIQKRAWADLRDLQRIIHETSDNELKLKAIEKKISLYSKIDTTIEKQSRLVGLENVHKNITSDDIIHVIKEFTRVLAKNYQGKEVQKIMGHFEHALLGKEIEVQVEDAEYEDVE